MNILLAKLRTLPNLVNGKVIVINADGTYISYNPSKYTTIKDGFNPLNYSILKHPKYSDCIVYSTVNEQVEYFIQKDREKQNSVLCRPYRTGDIIYIKSREGMYTIKNIQGDYIIITCDVWLKQGREPYVTIHKTDFKQICPGVNNNYTL